MEELIKEVKTFKVEDDQAEVDRLIKDWMNKANGIVTYKTEYKEKKDETFYLVTITIKYDSGEAASKDAPVISQD
jgi:hypothetical protein